jgi:sugar lactone lactonase YvrE
LNWFDPVARTHGSSKLPMRASAAAPLAGGGLVMATELGLATFDRLTLRTELVRPISLSQGFRTNDGKIDPLGRFWWSTMDNADGERPGSIFVTYPDLRTERVMEGVHIANAISFTSDGALLFLADSRLQIIWKCDAAEPRTRSVFAQTQGDAFPDGAAMDAEGFLWNAQWGASRLVRYAPDGSIDRIVHVPVSQPTSCAFGGKNLSTLYVTSAWDGLASSAEDRPALAGALFAFDPDVRGLELTTFKLFRHLPIEI